MIEDVLNQLDDAYTVDVLKKMIRISSVVGEEAELAHFLYEELDGLGFACEMHEVEPGRPNIYARLKGSGAGRKLNFNGHTDTVPVVAGWDSDPLVPLQKDGRIYGLGACDMKGGIACILNTLQAFAKSEVDFRGELSFSGVIDEEGYSKGARAMLDTDYGKADAVILAEPYPGNETKPIPLGITGKILYDVHVRGRAAHGFSPRLGINAVEEAARILAHLDRLHLKRHPNFGRGNLCTLKIEGGYRTYSVVVPDYCRFEVNRLLVPGETAANAKAGMESLIRELDLEAEVEVKIKPPRYEAFEMEKETPILRIFDAVYRQCMGTAPCYQYVGGVTDANVFAGEGGIPCLHLGPERGGPHEKNEYVPLDWLPKVSKMYTLIAARFLECAQPHSG